LFGFVDIEKFEIVDIFQSLTFHSDCFTDLEYVFHDIFRQIVDPFPARGFDEFVGESGLLIPVSLFKLTFDHGFRLGALAGLLIEGLALSLVCALGSLRLSGGAVGE
jgi:hypothetical protein